MNRDDALALAPLLVAAYLPVLVLLVSAYWKSTTGIAVLSLASLSATFGAIFVALPKAPRAVSPLVVVDRFSLFFIGLSVVAGIFVAVLSRDYLRSFPERGDRFYVLLLFAVFGMVAAVSSGHFATFFLGLETLTVSLLGLIGFTRRREHSLEGGIKYLVLAATSTSFLLFGIALVYADLGTMEFAALSAELRRRGGAPPAAALFGLGLIVVGFGFKLALAPFHMWSPDVYQGAPAPATALISSGSKAAIFAVLLRFVTLLGVGRDGVLYPVLLPIALLTMSVGNLLALRQRNMKRMLAYSSVAHMGYLLIPLLAGGGGGRAAFGFYLATYSLTIVAAFGVLTALSARGTEVEELDDLRGLGYRQRLPAAVLALAMLSLTGIPLTAGFVAKFYVFGAGVRAGLISLVVVGVVNSGLSAYYYLRVLVALYGPTDERPAVPVAPLHPWGAISLAALGVLLVLLGVHPTPLARLADASLGEGAALSADRGADDERAAARAAAANAAAARR